MKKFLSVLLILTLTLLTFTACSNEEPDETVLRVGYMKGPTGMGMAKLIHDNGGVNGNEKYTFTKYENTKLATTDLLTGKIDAICIPTNDAATYYNSEDSNSQVLAVNTLNTLFLLTDSSTSISDFSELEGKTIYTCKNGTPKVVLEYLLEAAEINATISTNVNGTELLTPANLGEAIVKGQVPIALAPEPIVTSSLLKNSSYSIDINLNTVWNAECDTVLPMGCIIASKSFITEHKSVIDNFLNEYKNSIKFISDSENLDKAAEYVVESGVLDAAPAAKSALKNLGNAIAYVDGKEMKTALEAFYTAIDFIKMPDSGFYYEK